MQNEKADWGKAAAIVRDAGGKIVGRTKLQKIAYLLELAGLGDGFHFEYRHYGPYSEDLASAIRLADAFGLVTEEERQATWGGSYSIYTAAGEAGEPNQSRVGLAQETVGMDSIELELAATAAYLSAVEKSKDPWGNTALLKPEKAANGRLEKAKDAYRKLLQIRTPKQLPQIV